MPLKRSRFNDLSREEAIALLNKLEGPLLAIMLQEDEAVSSCGVTGGVILAAICHDPVFRRVFAFTLDEWEAWEEFKWERGNGATEIGEFVNGPDENPWQGDFCGVCESLIQLVP